MSVQSFRKLALLALIALAAAWPSQAALSQEAGTPDLTGKTICLDPGHGGTEPGAINADNADFVLVEKDINLYVAGRLRDELSSVGAIVNMTRDPGVDDATAQNYRDATLSTNDRYTWCNNSGADIAVSIHTNSFSSPEPNYTLIIYFHRDDKALANAVIGPVGNLLTEGQRTAEPRIKKDAFGFVLKTEMPAITVEPVFMSNTEEALRLADCSNGVCPRRDQIAKALFDGIVAYFAAPPPDPGPGPGNGNGNGHGKKPR